MKKYLRLSVNFEKFSSSAEIPEIVRLARLDLQKRIRIADLVLWCCRYYPRKKALRKLIELGKDTETEENVAKSVFEFQDNEGFNCLITLFHVANKYIRINKKETSGPMLVDIEVSCLYLIEVAMSYNLDLETILNHTTKGGETLFHGATFYSEKLAIYLLEGVASDL